jgi:drug/metabolite transporter (DMT)-like permease
VAEPPRARGLRLKVLLAFAAIYLIWGSTFLAIHVTLATLPPFLMCAMRLTAAGLLLVGWARTRGDAWPHGREWGNAALVGVLLPAVGNTSVTVGEVHVASGLVALFLASIPLWVALLSAFGPPEGRPGPLAVTGLVLGFGGIALLIGPGLADVSHPHESPLWALVPVGGAFSWAWGTLWSRRVRLPRSPLMATGIGLFVGGALLFALSSVTGDFARVRWAEVGAPAWLALAYLAVFGSVVGFSCFLYLLRTVPPATVSTYAFVNPVVAMALGWAFAGEALPARTLAAAALVIASVVLITWTQARRVMRAAVAEAERLSA